jgi:hypothetical protein
MNTEHFQNLVIGSGVAGNIIHRRPTGRCSLFPAVA